MSTEQNKAIRRRVLAEIEVAGNLDAIDALLAPDVTIDGMAGPIRGREAQKGFTAAMHAAFSDLEGEIEDMVAQGDLIVSRWTFRGTHRGELMGIPAPGKRVTMTGMDVTRIVDGRITAMHIVMDQLGMLRQLGVIPS